MKIDTDALFANTYGTNRTCMVRGKGCMLWDSRGKCYLDFFSGIAVNALGYGNKKIAQKIAKQYQKLPHVSNLYLNEPAIELANSILQYQPIPNRTYTKLFFSNSGAEANEAALKFAALYIQNVHNRTPQFASFRHAFHGRTFLTLALTAKKKYIGMYEKILPKVINLSYNNIGTLHDKLNAKVGAVIVEVIQGEGGMRALSDNCALLLNRICNSKGIILIADEVQTGLGRTGTVYASEAVGLKPDIITLAKPIGGGLPLGVTLVTEKIAQFINPGIHGSTFGGGPLPCIAGQEIWREVTNPSFLSKVQKSSTILDEALVKLTSNCKIIKELRGFGLLRGIRLERDIDVGVVVKKICDAGLLVIPSGESVIRLAPPLVITKQEITQAIKILDNILRTY